MEDVSYAIESDIPPPVPPRDASVHDIEGTASGHSIEEQPQDGVHAESTSGYSCRTSFGREVFVR